jgi:hypothetical protein
VEARRAREAAEERAGCERHGWIGCGERERREGKATRTTTTTKKGGEIVWLAGRPDFGAVWALGSLQSTIIFQGGLFNI